MDRQYYKPYLHMNVLEYLQAGGRQVPAQFWSSRAVNKSKNEYSNDDDVGTSLQSCGL